MRNWKGTRDNANVSKEFDPESNQVSDTDESASEDEELANLGTEHYVVVG